MKYLLMSIVSLLMSQPLYAQDTPVATQDPEVTYEINIGDETEIKTINYNYNFGRVYVGDRRNAIFTLRNSSSLPIIIQDIDIDGEGFNGGDNCPRVLLRGDRCSVRVSFRPYNNGQYRGEVDMELSGHEDIRIRLRGRGVWFR
ncbi:hypothetical protein D3C72_1286610 [compost metagenome]